MTQRTLATFMLALGLATLAGCATPPGAAPRDWFIFLETGRKTPDDRAAVVAMQRGHIDNFKRLNDTYGHNTGDEALLHLVGTVRDCLRPHDTLSRYGGEEFVILLPETSVEDSVIVLQRLQRELTKRYFLANNDKLLITFSAGVTVVGHEEPQTSAIERADVAMYQAKATGKNRVVIAPGQPIAA